MYLLYLNIKKSHKLTLEFESFEWFLNCSKTIIFSAMIEN